MNRLQLLLAKLSEEGSEIAQIALKAQQFGLHEICPDQPLTNAERTHRELDDLMAAVEMLNKEFGFGYVPNRTNIEAKKVTINKYLAYSEAMHSVLQQAKDKYQEAMRSVLQSEKGQITVRELFTRTMRLMNETGDADETARKLGLEPDDIVYYGENFQPAIRIAAQNEFEEDGHTCLCGNTTPCKDCTSY